jgi:hypothetical protein
MQCELRRQRFVYSLSVLGEVAWERGYLLLLVHTLYDLVCLFDLIQRPIIHSIEGTLVKVKCHQREMDHHVIDQ